MKELNNKKVLVTGAGGFIGSHLVEALLQVGADVRVFARYNSRNDAGLLNLISKEKIDALDLVFGDIRDMDAVRKAMQGIDIVFHLGALIAIPYSYLHPTEVVETNVLGSMNVFLAARDLGTERVIHTSTSEVYGTALQIPISETHPLQGQSPYSASKIAADKIAESFYRSYDLPVVTVRPFNTYGPRQSARAVIPTIITQALTQDVVRLGNLDARRDLTYVEDTAAGFLRAAVAENVAGNTYNLGVGEDISIGDLAEEILRLVGRPVKIEIDEKRLRPEKSEVMRLISDNSLAKAELAWQPEISLSQGLQKTIDWIESNLDRFRVGVYEV